MDPMKSTIQNPRRQDVDLNRSSRDHGQLGTATLRSPSVYDADDVTLPLWLCCYLEINIEAIWLSFYKKKNQGSPLFVCSASWHGQFLKSWAAHHGTGCVYIMAWTTHHGIGQALWHEQRKFPQVTWNSTTFSMGIKKAIKFRESASCLDIALILQLTSFLCWAFQIISSCLMIHVVPI